jgi:hypothetical protein
MKLDPDLEELVWILKRVSRPHVIVIHEPFVDVIYFWKRKIDLPKIRRRLQKVEGQLVEFSAITDCSMSILIRRDRH